MFASLPVRRWTPSPSSVEARRHAPSWHCRCARLYGITTINGVTHGTEYPFLFPSALHRRQWKAKRLFLAESPFEMKPRIVELFPLAKGARFPFLLYPSSPSRPPHHLFSERLTCGKTKILHDVVRAGVVLLESNTESNVFLAVRMIAVFSSGPAHNVPRFFRGVEVLYRGDFETFLGARLR